MFASKDVSIGLRAAYPIARSVRLRSSASAYFNRTPASASNRQIWTWSGWVKRGVLGSLQIFFSANANAATDNDHTDIRFSASDTLQITNDTGGLVNASLITTQVFRDISAWYHIVVAVDTTQATASNRIKAYVNGTQITAFGTATYPAQNANFNVNNTINHRIGSYQPTSNFFDGYLAEINFIDGQALAPSSFGAFNIYGVWQPAKYQGTYGTNGFYLNFSDNSAATSAAIGKDSSGNGNNWTPNGINLTTPASTNTNWDSMTDVPTLTSASAANYATLNPLSIMGSGNSLTNGNLTFAGNGSSNIITTGTFGISSGKWYVEATITNGSGGVGFGIAKYTEPRGTGTVGNTSSTWGYNGVNGVIANNSSTLSTGATYTTGDVVAFALDMDAGTLVFYKNNSPQGSTVTGLSGIFLVAVSGYLSTVNLNFGQRPFTYTAPTGFVALNTYNLSAPPIPNGAAYMAATLYTGTNATQSITNTVNSVSFQPDLIWIKSRSTATQHLWWDSVRGILKTLSSDTTSAEQTETAGTGLNSFDSNGFTLGTDFSGVGSSNGSGRTYVGWQWKANGTGVTNTSGSITSTVSAGTTQGFSVVTYTGTGAAATVGHGLGAVPSMIIVKNRTSGTTENWQVYHQNMAASPQTNQLLLNSTAAVQAATVWNSTAPTSSVFSISNGAPVGASTNTYVAYCFAAVAGYSAFGSYTGNGSADGPFVYLGFRPRFLLIKRTDAIANWRIHDTSRDPGNVTSNSLYPNLSNAETSAASEYWDMLSNGFKLRTSDAESNASAGTYIYAAFAENPLKYSLAR